MVAGYRQRALHECRGFCRRRIVVLCQSSVAFVLVVLLAASAAAGPFGGLVIFGDSLSDVGNVAQATAELFFVPNTPGPHYYSGRFSNGPVYAESLAVGLGLPVTNHSRSGGENFAHGGAKTSGTTFPTTLAVRDVNVQVDNYVGRGPADSNALFVVWAGANDLLDGQTNMSVPVNRLATDIGRLIDAGASNFLVPNLPLLGNTPRFNGNPSSLATYNGLSEQFNAALAAMLDGLQSTHPAISLLRFDVAALFDAALTNPAAFGFTNVSDPAAPGLSPGTSSYDTSQIAANPDEYLFWDDLHPTTAAHAMLAEHALQLFALPGDVNGDGVVDAADYVLWRKHSGEAAEYDAWRSHFGQAGTGGGGLASGESQRAVVVPEPASAVLIVLALCFKHNRRAASRRSAQSVVRGFAC